MNTRELRVANTTKLPGPGLIADEKQGTWSGERYLREVLLNEYKAAIATGQKLRIDLDGTAGYGPSFIRETFKGLVRETKDKDILDKLEIKFDDDPYRRETLFAFIEEGIEELS